MAASGRNIVAAAVAAAFLFLAPAPVLAESAIEGLSNANKSFRDGDAAKALELISAVFSNGKMDNDTTAKALLLRGEIYEKLGKPALAYADYNNAIWLGGLSTAERNRANEGSQRTQSALGVAGGGGDSAQPRASNASTAAAPSSSNSFLGGLFGGDSAEPTKAAQPAKPPEAAPAKKPEPAQSAAAPNRKVAAAPQPAQTAAAPRTPAEAVDDKSYYSQFAAVQDEKKALTEAKRLADKLRDSLSGRPVLVIKTEPPGKPAVYRIVTGPLSNKAEASQLCSSLKAKGAGCTIYAP